MDGAGQVVSRLKEFCQSHGVDIKSELANYDFHKTGVISTVSLHRWIGSLGISLSNHNIQQLILSYSKDNGVDSQRLTADLAASQTYTATWTSKPVHCQNELRELARDLKIRQQTIRDVLLCYDRFNAGRVAPAHFYRAFGDNPMSHALANAYSIQGQVDYTRIANDLRDVQRTLSSTTRSIPAPTPAFEEFATVVKAESSDCRRAFRDQDRLTTGKVSRKQFIGVVSFLHSKISPAAFDELCGPFAEPDGDINYALLLQAIDEFVPPKPAASGAYVQSKIDPDAILARSRSLIEVRRINVASHFASLDKSRARPVISVGLFVRLVQAIRLDLTTEEIEAMAQLFKSDEGGVRYKDFIVAVSPSSQGSTNLNGVLARLKEFLSKSFLRLEESARRFDREGSGFISGQQLHSALHFTKFEFTPGEFALLRDGFADSTRSAVDWKALCEAVDPPPQPAPPPRPGPPKAFAPVPTGAVADLALKIYSAAQLANVDLVQAFKIVDYQRDGLVQREEFLSVLHRLPVQLTGTDDRVIFSFYRQNGSPCIDYMAFIESLKTLAAPKPAPVPEPAPSSRLDIPASVHGTLQRLKSFCAQSRVIGDDIFRAYDANNNGLIPVGKVEAGFHAIRFACEGTELRSFTRAFCDPRKPEIFNCTTFARALKEEDIQTAEVRSKLSSTPISFEIDREASIACGQIREKLMARHRRIWMAFAGLSDSPIPVADFQRRLNSVDLVLRANQTQSILRKYRFNLTDQIDWRQFCTDVDESKTIGSF
jgi:Ca2+-binding EF-hand superfamily protein